MIVSLLDVTIKVEVNHTDLKFCWAIIAGYGPMAPMVFKPPGAASKSGCSKFPENQISKKLLFLKISLSSLSLSLVAQLQWTYFKAFSNRFQVCRAAIQVLSRHESKINVGVISFVGVINLISFYL